MVALGIITGDLLIVIALLFGMQSIELPTYSLEFVYTLGAVILFFMGIKYLLKAPTRNTSSFISNKNHISSFLKGFGVNFFNPFVFIVWTGLYVNATKEYESEVSSGSYLFGVLAGIFTLDITKVFLAEKIKPMLTVKYLRPISFAIGILMLGFGIRLLVYLFTL